MARRLLIVLLGLVLLLAAADVVYWSVAQQRLEAGFAAWSAARRTGGWTLTSAKPQRGGWPFAASLTVPNVVLHGGQPDIPGGLTWSTDRLILRVALLTPHRLEIESAGLQNLRPGEGADIPYTADRLRAWVPLEPDTPPRSATLTAANLRARLPGILPAAVPGALPGALPVVGPGVVPGVVPLGSDTAVTVATLDLRGETKPAAAQSEAALTLWLEAGGIGLPSGRRWPLGPRVRQLDLEAALDGPVPPTSGLTARATAWRDAGGSLEVRHISLAWGALDLTGSATLALDQQLQPMGAGTAQLTGYADALETLAANGAVKGSAVTAAKAVLSLLASTPDDGGPAVVDVPLTLQARTLALRQVPLMRLPELAWPVR